MIAAPLYRHLSRRHIVALAAGVLFLLLLFSFFPEYMPFRSVNFLLGLIGLPVIMSGCRYQGPSSRFVYAALPFAVLSLLLPGKTILFIAVVLAMIGCIEQLWRRLPLLALLVLAFMTATVQYLAGVMSFPLRLWLTGVTGRLAGMVVKGVSTQGNIILLAGRSYAVDPACMGVKMLLTTLICGLIVVALQQRRYGRYLAGHSIAALLAAAFALNLLSNLIRMLVLVCLHIPAGTPMHDVVGLACLIVYVLLPAIALCGLLVRRAGLAAPAATVSPVASSWGRVLSGAVLLLLLVSAVARRSVAPAAHTLPQVAGYQASFFAAGVLQYSSPAALVYIKKIDGVLSGEHDPVMCWLGAGYTFCQISESSIGGQQVYTGTLQQGSRYLYTAWWYDDGAHRTTNMWAWRWQVLRGARPYAVINVTAASATALQVQLVHIMGHHVFGQVLAPAPVLALRQ